MNQCNSTMTYRKQDMSLRKLSSVCRICHQIFRNVKDLNGHIKTHANEQELQRCPTRDSKSFDGDALQTHVVAEPEEKPYICELCHLAFRDSASLSLHSRSHSVVRPHQYEGGISMEDKMYECKFCAETFNHIEVFVCHAKIHNIDGKPYKCGFCEKAFANSFHLDVHERTHIEEKPYKCEICDQAFTHTGAMKAHKRSHTVEKPITCNVCHMAFAHSWHLVVHTRTHAVENPYKCQLCEKGFVSTQLLKEHVMTHAGNKPYKCNLCDTAFGQIEGLNSHVKLNACEKIGQSELCRADESNSNRRFSACLRDYRSGNKDQLPSTGTMLSSTAASLHASVRSTSIAGLNCFTAGVYGCGLCDRMFESDKEFFEHCCLHCDISETDTFVDLFEGHLPSCPCGS